MKIRKKRTLELTEVEAAEYALAQYGFHLPISRLQQSRIGRCHGPKFIKKDGWAVRYLPKHIDEYIAANRSRVVDPAELVAEAS